MKKPRYVIFDCDGVLMDSEMLANRVEMEIKTEMGFPISLEEQILKFTGCGLNHPTVQEELRRLPKEYLSELEKRCEEVFRAELKPIAGVEYTLENLNLPKCMASSSEPEYLAAKLEITGLNRFFVNTVFHGKMVKRSKPAPDLFLHAVEKMGWRKPEDCLVVEDSEHGVRAGKAAGMIVCGFLGGAHIYPGHAERLLNAGADYLVSDIRNILRLTN